MSQTMAFFPARTGSGLYFSHELQLTSSSNLGNLACAPNAYLPSTYNLHLVREMWSVK